MEGKPVTYLEMVAADRRLAHALVSRGRPMILCSEGGWGGVWDLKRLTDGEAVDWGLWVTRRTLRE